MRRSGLSITGAITSGQWLNFSTRTVATSPVTKEAPTLYVDDRGRYQVFVPAVQRDQAGVSWANGLPAGTSIITNG